MMSDTQQHWDIKRNAQNWMEPEINFQGASNAFPTRNISQMQPWSLPPAQHGNMEEMDGDGTSHADLSGQR